MSKFIDINNREQLKRLLLLIAPDNKPLWGKMKAHQMVEHLVESIIYTNGKRTCSCDRPDEDAYNAKQEGVYTDDEIPKNVILGPLPDQYGYADSKHFTHHLKQFGVWPEYNHNKV